MSSFLCPTKKALKQQLQCNRRHKFKGKNMNEIVKERHLNKERKALVCYKTNALKWFQSF